MQEHYLKCSPQFMPRIACGQKKFEIRKNDRDYQVGDVIHLEDYVEGRKIQWAGEFRHPNITAKIVYISSAYQQEGYVVLGIDVTNNQPNEGEL